MGRAARCEMKSARGCACAGRGGVSQASVARAGHGGWGLASAHHVVLAAADQVAAVARPAAAEQPTKVRAETNQQRLRRRALRACQEGAPRVAVAWGVGERSGKRSGAARGAERTKVIHREDAVARREGEALAVGGEGERVDRGVAHVPRRARRVPRERPVRVSSDGDGVSDASTSAATALAAERRRAALLRFPPVVEEQPAVDVRRHEARVGAWHPLEHAHPGTVGATLLAARHRDAARGAAPPLQRSPQQDLAREEAHEQLELGRARAARRRPLAPVQVVARRPGPHLQHVGRLAGGGALIGEVQAVGDVVHEEAGIGSPAVAQRRAARERGRPREGRAQEPGDLRRARLRKTLRGELVDDVAVRDELLELRSSFAGHLHSHEVSQVSMAGACGGLQSTNRFLEPRGTQRCDNCISVPDDNCPIKPPLSTHPGRLGPI